MQSDNILAAKSVSPRFRMARHADAPRQQWLGRPTEKRALAIAGERKSLLDDVLGVIGQQAKAGVTEASADA